MTTMLKLGNALTALAAGAAAVIGAQQSQAADLYEGRGSLKDTPVLMHAPAGPCYLRSDVGYSFSGTPSVTWPVTNAQGDLIGAKVTDIRVQDTYVLEGGIGCASAGWRGEVVFGYRGNRHIDGVPPTWTPGPNVQDPLHARLTSYTAMINGYRDLATWGNFTPYVGAGMGVAYHMLDNVTFTQNPFLLNEIEGSRDLSFAWQLMAGIDYRLSDRATLDLGYRYVDLGKATSGRADTAGFVNPRVVFDDLTSHEIKIGLRYQFGGDDRSYALK